MMRPFRRLPARAIELHRDKWQVSEPLVRNGHTQYSRSCNELHSPNHQVNSYLDQRYEEFEDPKRLQPYRYLRAVM